MENLHLSGEIPDNISNCIHLRYLELNCCQLTGPFPSGIRELHNLEYLNLQDNELTGSLPDQLFTNLTNLRDFSIQENRLQPFLSNDIENCINLNHINIFQKTEIPSGDIKQFFLLLASGRINSSCFIDIIYHKNHIFDDDSRYRRGTSVTQYAEEMAIKFENAEDILM